MSDPVSPLGGATAHGIAELQELGLQGMVTVRANLSDAAVRTAVTEVTELSFPDQGRCTIKGTDTLAWMSPDELLLVSTYASIEAKVAGLQTELKAVHALAVNVSDARALFALRGAGACDVLAKLAPVDLHPDVFVPGTFRRTRLAQIPAAFWRHADQEFRIITFRSTAQYAFDVLRTALVGDPVVTAV